MCGLFLDVTCACELRACGRRRRCGGVGGGGVLRIFFVFRFFFLIFTEIIYRREKL